MKIKDQLAEALQVLLSVFEEKISGRSAESEAGLVAVTGIAKSALERFHDEHESEVSDSITLAQLNYKLLAYDKKLNLGHVWIRPLVEYLYTGKFIAPEQEVAATAIEDQVRALPVHEPIDKYSQAEGAHPLELMESIEDLEKRLKIAELLIQHLGQKSAYETLVSLSDKP